MFRGFAEMFRGFAEIRGCFAGVSRIHERRFTCFAAVSQQSRIVNLCSRPVALRSLQVAVVDGPAGGASERHEHWHVSFQMLRALRTAHQYMIRGSSGSYRAAPHDAMPCDAMPAMRCCARAREGRGGLKPPLDPIVSTM